MIAETPEQNAIESGSPPRRIRALLIEDNPGDARLIEVMLAEADGESFAVRHVDRLEDGLRELASGNVDVVLSDLSLPDSHGLDTFLRLHGRAPHVPIIVLS